MYYCCRTVLLYYCFTVLYCTCVLLHWTVVLLYCTVLYCTVLYCTAPYCTVPYYTVLYCTVLYCTVLYCTVLYCTILYCTVLYQVLYCTVLNCLAFLLLSDDSFFANPCLSTSIITLCEADAELYYNVYRSEQRLMRNSYSRGISHWSVIGKKMFPILVRSDCTSTRYIWTSTVTN